MPNKPFLPIITRVLSGGGIVALVAAIVQAIGCFVPNTQCRLGVDTSAGYAAAVLFIVLALGGSVVLGAVAFPIGQVLHRRNRLGFWSMSFIGAVCAIAPVIFLYEVAGFSLLEWKLWRLGPGIPIALGGFSGGAFLWLSWFRHEN